MQNFGQGLQRTTILKELPNANTELGEAFAYILADMVMQTGITNPKAESFELVSPNWKKLAAKPDKTDEEIKKLDTDFRDEIDCLAQSYLLYMAKETRNLTGKLEYQQYEAFMLKYRFGRYDIMNQPEYMKKVKAQIRNAFNKISAHGEAVGDNLIDKSDMAVFLYALATKTTHDENNKFKGFEINGVITPEEYALNEHFLFEPEDNLMSIKLRIAYNVLNNKI